MCELHIICVCIVANPRTVFSYREHGLQGIVDGMTIDTDGNLWIANFDGSQVTTPCFIITLVSVYTNLQGDSYIHIDMQKSRLPAIGVGRGYNSPHATILNFLYVFSFLFHKHTVYIYFRQSFSLKRIDLYMWHIRRSIPKSFSTIFLLAFCDNVQTIPFPFLVTTLSVYTALLYVRY